MSACHNCGLPDGAKSAPGRIITITVKPENSFQRQRKIAVWTCCDECAHQAMAEAKYGPATFRWPVTLAQFRGQNRLPKQD